ncbi:protein US26 [Aotine betaherpesvirus 1]|uniref:Protein US26 n=1 Tax=Aotine betaherpesvirus 1 TaxID=50290 RepID=G8XUL1_9BETA|nr:protein US26 [Aotine betaherpesvirus 1]AEV80853.1 protein US26 [Aotine betaherpesvirus 1]
MALQSSYRYVAAPKVRSTLRSFRDFIISQDSRYDIRTLVCERHKKRVSTAIPAPPGWRLHFAPYNAVFGNGDEDDTLPLPWEPLMCCDNPLEVLGVLRYTEPGTDAQGPQDSDEEDYDEVRPPGEGPDGRPDRSPVLLMGRYETIWCFDRVQTTLYNVASSFDSLARKGLLHLEILYRQPEMQSFQLTEYPGQIVSELLQASKESLSELRRTLCRHRWQMLSLRTPGEQTRLLQLCSCPFDVQAFWPFMCMDAESLEELFTTLAEQLCCRGLVLGTVGECLPSGVFHAEYVLLVDETGCVYYFSIIARELWKLADDLTMLFRIGLMKLYTKGTRFNTARGDAEQLEVPGRCPHQMHSMWDRYSHVEYLSGARNYKARYHWLIRYDRFETDDFSASCFRRNGGDAAVGAADGSWNPRYRYDLPQEAEVNTALEHWKRYARGTNSLPYPPRTQNYSIVVDAELSAEVHRLKQTTDCSSSASFDVDEEDVEDAKTIALRRVAKTVIREGKQPVYPDIPKPGYYIPPWM